MGSDQSAVRSLPCHDLTADWSLPISLLVWVRSFIEPDLFDNSVPFDNTTPIFLINLLWKLGLGLGFDSELHYFSIFTKNRIPCPCPKLDTSIKKPVYIFCQ